MYAVRAISSLTLLTYIGSPIAFTKSYNKIIAA